LLKKKILNFFFLFPKIGAGAFAGAVTHTISAAVIIWEITGTIVIGLPTVVCLFAYFCLFATIFVCRFARWLRWGSQSDLVLYRFMIQFVK
jgi:hypothetical protein